jgi:hypothetical protein
MTKLLETQIPLSSLQLQSENLWVKYPTAIKKKPIKNKKKTHNSHSMYSSNQNPYAHLVTSSRQAPYLVHFSTYKLVLLLTENPFFPLASSFWLLIKKAHFFHLQAHSVSTSNQNPFLPIFSLPSSFCAHIKPKPIFAHLLTYKLIL